MCLNSISHHPSGSVLTSSSSWKDVGNPQCWGGPGWPLWARGTSSARKVSVATDRGAVLCQPAQPTTLSHITDSRLTLAAGTLYITWGGTVGRICHSPPSKPFVTLLSEDRICLVRCAVSSGRPQYTLYTKLYTLTCMWRIANGMSFLPPLLWLTLISKGRLSSWMVKSPGLHTA